MALVAIGTGRSHGDRVVFKGGRPPLEGVIEEETRGRVILLYQGQRIVIPRSRIESIEKEDGADRVKNLIDHARAALGNDDLAKAEEHLANAKVLDSKDLRHAVELNRLAQEISKLKAGTAKPRNQAAAEKLLEEAVRSFDRIEISEGLRFLLQSFEADDSRSEAHDQMAIYMREYGPLSDDLLMSYFSDYLEIEQIQPGYPIAGLMPQVVEEAAARYYAARDSEAIALASSLVRKASGGIDDHAEWGSKADARQRNVIELGADGIFRRGVEGALESGDFKLAMARLNAWGAPEESLEIAQYFIRTLTGLGEIGIAKDGLAAIREVAPELEWAEKSYNAVVLYENSRRARNSGNDQIVRDLLTRLFRARENLYPELYALVAADKVVFDLEAASRFTAQGKYNQAADLLLRVYDYTVDRETRERARTGFFSVSPKIAYKCEFTWFADGVEIPTLKGTIDVLKTKLGGQYNLHFDDKSPFTLSVTLRLKTENRSGKRLSELALEKKAYEVDLLDPDDVVIGLNYGIRVSHELAPELYQTDAAPALSRQASLGYEDRKRGPIYFNLTQHRDIEGFIDEEIDLYLPSRLGGIGGQMTLPLK